MLFQLVVYRRNNLVRFRDLFSVTMATARFRGVWSASRLHAHSLTAAPCLLCLQFGTTGIRRQGSRRRRRIARKQCRRRVPPTSGADGRARGGSADVTGSEALPGGRRGSRSADDRSRRAAASRGGRRRPFVRPTHVTVV